MPRGTADVRPGTTDTRVPVRPAPRAAASRPGRPSLVDLSAEALTDVLSRLGEPAYRGPQIEHWIYRQFARRAADMSNLPSALRARLDAQYDVWPLTLQTYAVSRNGDTLKALFRLADGACVEAVLMLYDQRQTLCISSQVGCAMACTFCATGQDGLTRNLTPGEIVGQVLYLARLLAQRDALALGLQARSARVSNVVFMGMGEPFHNYDAVWRAIPRLASERYCGLGARRITISTVGVAPQIAAMAQEPWPVRLAVSLHAPNDALRAQLVPPARRWPLQEVLRAVRTYTRRTRRRVSFEYVMLDGINDHPQLGADLGRLVQGLPCHVNLIPFNPIPGGRYQPSPDGRIRAFARRVGAAGIPVTIRVKRGIEMDAGCGQLKRRAAVNASRPGDRPR